MTLEDDVESILSEQFNASNDSMFRVKPRGDSTYRANEDSVHGIDDEKAAISESDDGVWHASDKDTT